jgi:xylose isomerase
MSRFRFTTGPWNVAEGVDMYGPATRKPLTLEEKVARFAEMGFSAVQFHDDDAVPDISAKSEDEIRDEARAVGALLARYGLGAEFVAPRLWFEPQFKDGAYTAPIKENWEHALWRSYRAIDIARELGAGFVALWLAREGTPCMESKSPVASINQLIASLDAMLEYDPTIRIAIEPKPNEPIDRSYAGTAGHALALASRTIDPDRVGLLVESAHSMMAGLEATHDMALGMAFGKLMSVHLNDQNGAKYDQDKIFGSENLRSSFNQIRLLCENGYGSRGEFIGLDVKAMRSSSDEYGFKHLANSLRIVERLEAKVDLWDQGVVDDMVAKGDYEGVEMYTVDLLLG